MLWLLRGRFSTSVGLMVPEISEEVVEINSAPAAETLTVCAAVPTASVTSTLAGCAT